MKELVAELIAAAEALLESPSADASERLQQAVTRLKTATPDRRVFVDLDSILKRVSNSDWHFMADPHGRMMLVIRRRGVMESIDLATFLRSKAAQ